MGTVRLKTSDLSLDVPGRRLLDDVSFTVEAGECLAITGPSGSGKTSLLNCLCGITTASSGLVQVDGVDLNSLGVSKRAAFRLQHIGMVFQFGELLPELTALENIALPLRLMGSSRREAERQAGAWLDRLGLCGRGGEHPDVLSGGEVQRIGVARALAHGPGLVLADEPTGSVDEDNTVRIAELLASAAKELGATVVVTTHDPLVASKANRVLRLRDGRLDPADDLGRPMQEAQV